MDEIRGRIRGDLADDVANRVGDGGVKKHSSRLHAREIDAHELAFLEHENILDSSWAFCNMRRFLAGQFEFRLPLSRLAIQTDPVSGALLALRDEFSRVPMCAERLTTLAGNAYHPFDTSR